MAVRPWSPVELPGVVLWACGDDVAAESGGAAVRVTNRADGTAIVPGAQPAVHYGPSRSEETLAGKAVFSSTEDHRAYLVAPGTEAAMEGAQGWTAFVVHRLAEDLPSGVRSVVLSISDSEGGELGAVAFGTQAPPVPVRNEPHLFTPVKSSEVPWPVTPQVLPRGLVVLGGRARVLKID